MSTITTTELLARFDGAQKQAAFEQLNTVLETAAVENRQPSGDEIRVLRDAARELDISLEAIGQLEAATKSFVRDDFQCRQTIADHADAEEALAQAYAAMQEAFDTARRLIRDAHAPLRAVWLRVKHAEHDHKTLVDQQNRQGELVTEHAIRVREILESDRQPKELVR